MESRIPWWKPTPLEKAFVALSYEEIARVLDRVGTRYFVPIETIPKQLIFAALEDDCPAEEIAAAMVEAKRGTEEERRRLAPQPRASRPVPPQHQAGLSEFTQ